MSSLFEQIREIVPAPGANFQFEIPYALFEAWDQQAPVENALLANHIESVAEFLAYKAEHPRDGTMLVLYSWAPIITIMVSIVTFNPMIGMVGLGMGLQRRRERRVSQELRRSLEKARAL